MSNTVSQIKFGTDGWRAIIADTYTLENVRILTQAVADYLGTGKKVDAPAVVDAVDAAAHVDGSAAVDASEVEDGAGDGGEAG